ncbi:kinetochore-associated protein KNL-2 homolog isoform X2 [Cornus florida]|nr:kinetochore-associated protein KNL-2 homolog isoform X2 [Cornus florida]XP_059653569.1 kinetochore-associated protein KNL-2 homolog isoform X2 [Cornus florida]
MANPYPNLNQKTLKATTICSSFIKNVYLHDWWLIKADLGSGSRQLGVGGFSSRESRGIRAFRAAAIAKRHDTVTLETVDGITVTLSGFINRSLTLQSGFPSEVCNHFLFGFPYCWEVYAARCFGEESTSRAVPSRVSSLDGFNMSSNDGSNSSPPICLDDLPVTQIRDIVMSTLDDSENSLLAKNIFSDMLREYGGNTFKDNGASCHSNTGKSSPIKTGNSVLNETPSDKKLKVKRKFRSDDGISHATDMGREMGIPSSSKGIATRSMTRLKNLKSKQEENLSVNPNIKQGTCEPISASEVSGNQSGGIRTGSDSNMSDAAIISEEETKAKDSHNRSTDKKSGKLKTLSKSFSRSEASRNQHVGVVTRGKSSNVLYASIVSEQEKKVKETPDKSAKRRSKRLKNVMNDL